MYPLFLGFFTFNIFVDEGLFIIRKIVVHIISYFQEDLYMKIVNLYLYMHNMILNTMFTIRICKYRKVENKICSELLGLINKNTGRLI